MNTEQQLELLGQTLAELTRSHLELMRKHEDLAKEHEALVQKHEALVRELQSMIAQAMGPNGVDPATAQAIRARAVRIARIRNNQNTVNT